MAEDRAVGTPVLRRLNTAAVLRAVRERAPDPVRLSELAELTGLTRPTVAQAVDDLLRSGWLQQHHPTASPRLGGRPAIRVSLRGRAAPVLGLDVGPHTVSAGIGDLSGARPAAVRRAVASASRSARTRGPGGTGGTGARPGGGAAELLGVVDEAIGESLAAADLAAGEVAAVVAATPGIVEAGTGRILLAPSVPGWSQADLAGHLRERFGCPVLIENDANLAALAVAAEPPGRSGTLLAVQWGERLGAGVVIDGRLHRGSGSAGEIGFIRPAEEVPDTGDGRGPLERVIGAAAIADRGRGAGGGGFADAAALFAAASAGDPAAAAIVDEVAGIFARAVAPAVLVLAPDAIVIGGGIARAGQVLRAAVARHLTGLTLVPPDVELSGLAEDTVLTGALHLALDEVWHRATI